MIGKKNRGLRVVFKMETWGRILSDPARRHRRRNQIREEEVITVNMIELWKVEHSNTYMNWVGLYGYERAQEMVLAAMESRPKKRK